MASEFDVLVAVETTTVFDVPVTAVLQTTVVLAPGAAAEVGAWVDVCVAASPIAVAQ